MLVSGGSATPSTAVVYQIALEDPLVVINVDITEAGAYALFLEHGADEVPVAFVSASGTVLVAGAEEGGDADEEAEEEEEEDSDEDDAASGTQWANALIASLVVSACRY